MTVELHLLGTGTPTPLAHRAGSGYLLSIDNEKILLDCGPGIVRRLLEKGEELTGIDTLLLTHLHYDHCVDFAYFALTRWDQGAGKVRELAVIGPPGTRTMTDRLLGSAGAFAPDLAARTQHPGSQFIYEARGGVLPRELPSPTVEEVTHGDELDRGEWVMRVAEVVHVQPQLTCLAYRVETQGTSVVFGGDTAPTEALVELARGAHILIHMCHFLNGTVVDPRLTGFCSGHLDAARTATDAGVDTLVLIHLTEQMQGPGIREKIVAEASSLFKGDIVYGEDLLQVPINGVEVARIS
jgi:ribonuclease BN (tRNA processing enzyme)